MLRREKIQLKAKLFKQIADMADSIVGGISRYLWDMAVTRIGQLESEMRLFFLNHARNPKKTAQKFGINGEKL